MGFELRQSVRALLNTCGLSYMDIPIPWIYTHIDSLKLSTDDKILANRISDLKYRVYSQKKFSWIYMYSTSVDV
jgi:hypothetical protein